MFLVYIYRWTTKAECMDIRHVWSQKYSFSINSKQKTYNFSEKARPNYLFIIHKICNERVGPWTNCTVKLPPHSSSSSSLSSWKKGFSDCLESKVGPGRTCLLLLTSTAASDLALHLSQFGPLFRLLHIFHVFLSLFQERRSCRSWCPGQPPYSFPSLPQLKLKLLNTSQARRNWPAQKFVKT